ncbi:hypothetical protein IC582_011819 [Cucumis melo]
MNIRFLKTSITRSAKISRPFKLSILRSLLDEHHFGTIYGIRLRNLQTKPSKLAKLLIN